MKKNLICLGLFLVLIFSLLPIQADRLFYDNKWHEYNAPPIFLYVNDRLVAPDVPPIIINDRTLVPIRFVTQALGGEVFWDEKTQSVKVIIDDNTLILSINNHESLLNGEKIKMNKEDPPPKIVNDRCMIPIRFVSENLGYSVSFDEEERKVNIYNEAPSKVENDILDKSHFDKIFNIEYEPLDGGDRIVIDTKFNLSPKTLKLKEPNRLVFDFPNTSLDIKNGNFEEGNLVDNIRYGSHDTFTRIAMNVEEYPSYIVKKVKEKIYIDILDDIFYFSYDGLSNKKLSFDGKFRLSKAKFQDNIYTVNIHTTAIGEGSIDINDEFIEKITFTKDEKNKLTKVEIYTKTEKLEFNEISSSSTEISYLPLEEDEEDEDEETVHEDEEEYIIDDKFIKNDIVIVLDSGHGGLDPGAVGTNPDGSKTYEKDINLDITLKTEKFLIDAGATVILTPTKNLSSNEKLELSERVLISNNNKPTVFISIHNNAVDKNKDSVMGTIVFYKPDSQDVLKGTSVEVNSKELSQYILDSIVENTGLKKNNVRDGGNFYVIKHNEYPAILIECAFLTNSKDLELLNDEDFRTLLAKSIAKGIITYINKISN